MEKKLLVVVDMQNDFVTGSLGSEKAQKIVPNVVEKVKAADKDRNTVIVYTKDMHYENYYNTHEGKYLPIRHCKNGSRGARIISELSDYIDEDDTMTVLKNTFGYLRWEYLIQGFLGIDAEITITSIEIIGLVTDICVVSNALMLRSLFSELDITVDASCCAGTTPERHKAALEVMKSCHIDVINE